MGPSKILTLSVFIHGSDNPITRRTLTPLSCRVVKNNIYLILHYLYNTWLSVSLFIRIKLMDFVDWILLLEFHLLHCLWLSSVLSFPPEF